MEEPMTGWATEEQIEETFKAYQQGGKEGLLKLYKARSQAAKEQKDSSTASAKTSQSGISSPNA